MGNPTKWIVESRQPAMLILGPGNLLQEFDSGIHIALPTSLALRSGTSAHFLSDFAVLVDREALDSIVLLEPDVRVFENEVIDFHLPPLDDGPGGAGELDNVQAWSIDHWSLDQFWQRGILGANVTVGIVDSGLDAGHPAFHADVRSGRIKAFASFDEGGLKVPGKDVFGPPVGDDKAVPTFTHWHGTHCAGTICAGALPNKVVGVAPSADLVVSSALDVNNHGSVASIYSSLVWLRQWRCDFVSLSLEWNGFHDQWSKPIQDLIADGTVVIAASGNDFGFADLEPTASPGNYPLSASLSPKGFLMSVGAIDVNEVLWDHSGGGKVVWPLEIKSPDGTSRPTIFAGSAPFKVPSIVGPGMAVPSTIPHAEYGNATGTSMAAPFVVGMASLVLSWLRARDAAATPRRAMEILFGSVRPLTTAVADDRTGSGTIDWQHLLDFIDSSSA